ncbi:hypothetical protein [Sphingomonas sp.]|uniref:hypothetical protein n=1 Tax=Sphingomonas sp. TaxID=28214 RepID=UPI002D7E19C8|nr:hypothetical protein [Sphingomonas sp.]
MGDEIIARSGGRHVQLREVKHGWTAARRKQFLDVLATCANVKLAARTVGVHTTTAYSLKRRDPAFNALWQEAIDQGFDHLEQALIDKAFGNLNPDVLEPGEVVATGRVDGTGWPPAVLIGDKVEIDVKLIQWLLERQERRRAKAFGRPRVPVTREAVEAKILKKLDALARRQGSAD